MKPGVFIGCPSHDGRLDQGCSLHLFGEASRDHPNCVMISRFAPVTPACNKLWAEALNTRASVAGMAGCTDVRYFAMLHSDINPGPWWVDRLIAELEENDADLMSAVVPIKSQEGLTSTAMSDPDDSTRNWCRLTLRQVNHEFFPETFDAAMARDALASLPSDLAVECPDGSRLLVNTGCFVIRLDRPWSGDVWFEQVDRVVRDGGRFHVLALSEDWCFSRMVADRGGRVMATTVLETTHTGPAEFTSGAIGGWARDLDSSAIARSRLPRADGRRPIVYSEAR